MDEHSTAFHAHVERGDSLDKRRRRDAGVRQVLVAVPWTSNATIENFTLAQRAVLVLADVRNCGDFAVLCEDRDALARQADDSSAFLRDAVDSANIEVSFICSSRGSEARIIRAALCVVRGA